MGCLRFEQIGPNFKHTIFASILYCALYCFWDFVKSDMLIDHRLTEEHLPAFSPNAVVRPVVDVVRPILLAMIASATITTEDTAGQVEIIKFFGKRYQVKPFIQLRGTCFLCLPLANRTHYESKE
jgi:hypothetical protein